MSVPKVVGCKPIGQQVLVEHLTDNEQMGTSMILPGKAKSVDGEMQQSYILAIGPMLDAEKWGFKVGDRVMVQGTYNPVPRFDGEDEKGREKGLVEPHNIRGILIEKTE